jgi:hypothetical protein
MSIPADRILDSFAISADGLRVAYAAELPDGRLHLFVHRVNDSVPGAAGDDQEISQAVGAHDPFFAADAQSIAYFWHDAIWAASLSGGAARRVCDAPGESAGGTWTDDGRIVFAPLGGEGLFAISSSGGVPEHLTALDARAGEIAHGWPQALPGGGIVFTVSQRGRDPHLEILSAEKKRGTRLVPAIGQAEFVSTGYLVYSYLGDLYALPFDAEAGKATGVPVAFAKGVQTSSGFDQLGHSGFAVSRSGTLGWVRAGAGDADSELVTVTNSGVVTRMGAAAAAYQTPRISPKGDRLAIVVRSGLMTRDIKVIEMAHPERAGVIRGGDNQSPAWTPDGRLSFASNREGLQRIYVTGARDAVAPLFSMEVEAPRNPASWVAKPPLLAFYEIDPLRRRDVLVYRVGEAILPVAATAANERSPVLSPDGQSIAWVSDASGRDEVYVKKLDESSQAERITDKGGVEPVWGHEGLVYREGDRLVRAGTTLFEGRFERDPGANAAAYDVDPRGKFFVMLKSARRPKEIRLVTNWRP